MIVSSALRGSGVPAVDVAVFALVLGQLTGVLVSMFAERETGFWRADRRLRCGFDHGGDSGDKARNVWP